MPTCHMTEREGGVQGQASGVWCVVGVVGCGVCGGMCVAGVAKMVGGDEEEMGGWFPLFLFLSRLPNVPLPHATKTAMLCYVCRACSKRKAKGVRAGMAKCRCLFPPVHLSVCPPPLQAKGRWYEMGGEGEEREGSEEK